MNILTLRRKLQAELKRVDDNFTKHLNTNGKNEFARSSCCVCNNWGEIRGLKNAIELTKKKPDLDLEIS